MSTHDVAGYRCPEEGCEFDVTAETVGTDPDFTEAVEHHKMLHREFPFDPNMERLVDLMGVRDPRGWSFSEQVEARNYAEVHGRPELASYLDMIVRERVKLCG